MKTRDKLRRVSLRQQLKAWSKEVRNRDNNRCVVCGSDRFIQAHHLLCRHKFPQYKLDLVNGISLCCVHHKFGVLAAHTNPFWWYQWLQANLPAVFTWCLLRSLPPSVASQPLGKVEVAQAPASGSEIPAQPTTTHKEENNE